MAQDVSGQVDTSLVDGDLMYAANINDPVEDLTGVINNILNGAQDADALRFGELASDPATPATGKWKLYAKSAGLFLMDDGGVLTGPMIDAAGIDASTITYTPASLPDWDSSTDPGNVDDALDQIADRLTTVEGGGGGGGAPDNATFITQTPSAGLTSEQALSALATGLLKNTTSTGVLSIATASDVPDLPASKITSGELAIAQGGTGQATATAAFDALSPVTTAGDLIRRGASSNERLAVGSNGQVLTVVTGAPAWADPSGGTMVELVANTILGSAASSISLTSIPGTSAHLRLIMRLRSDRAGQTQDGILIRFNSDSGSNYAWARAVISNAGTAGGDGATSATGIAVTNAVVAATGTANAVSTVVIDLLNYAETGFARGLVGTINFIASTSQTGVFNGNWLNTANAITQIDISPLAGSNFIAGSSYGLYGIG